MQGAAINTANSSSYGDITTYNNVGVYELVSVQSVSGNTIVLSAALAHPFAVSTTQRVQVVRIPRLSSLTVNASASLTGQAWGSSYTGGVVAIEVTGNATVNGTIDANGIGYRGGALDLHSSKLFPHITDYLSTRDSLGAEKGESIAGYQGDYDALGGRYCMGAPANGGGGGNGHNCGGGGGANGGNPAGWDGKGNPDISVTSWKQAWDLESTSFSTHTSSGGGRGGYSFSAKDGNATGTRPDPPGDGTWGGDDRQNSGGLGGRPLTYASNTLFMGGGGGAGDQNNPLVTPGSNAGGNGGGIIYLTITGTLSGTGTINANGAAGADVVGINADAQNGIEAASGGGAGGAVKLNVLGGISGVGLYAKGGNGGNQKLFNLVPEAEGPGGGGGGGYIAVTGSPSITMSTTGGVNGTTNSAGLTEFLPNGATKADNGSTITNISYQIPPPQVVLPLSFLSFNLLSENGGEMLVSWIVANEINAFRYDLEQSSGDGNWRFVQSEMASRETATTKQYSITIGRPFQTTYFRLKMTDKNGAHFYSSVEIFKPHSRSFLMKENAHLIEIYELEQLNVRLFNNSGLQITSVLEKTSGMVRIDKDRLTKGVYYIVVSSGDVKETFRFIR